MPNNDTSSRVQRRFSKHDDPQQSTDDHDGRSGEDEAVKDVSDESEYTTPTHTTDERSIDDGDELVRIQFRVPEHLRDEFNRVAYSKLDLQDERASELDRNELQAAAAKLLMENTDLWWETAEEMHLDDDQ